MVVLRPLETPPVVPEVLSLHILPVSSRKDLHLLLICLLCYLPSIPSIHQISSM